MRHADWNDFQHVTDTGLTVEIFEKWFLRVPYSEEVMRIKSHFRNLLAENVHQFTEVENSLAFIELISLHPDVELGFATGGWKETAELKCEAVGLKLDEYMVKSSNDHYHRAKIIELVVEKALSKHNLQEFETITYFGDGLWDFTTTQTLGIEFIGVDVHANEKLTNRGVEKVIRNFREVEKILNWITRELR